MSRLESDDGEESVLVVMIVVRSVPMTVVQIVHVVCVLDRLVAAVGAVDVFWVGVGLVLWCTHGHQDTREIQT
jgi:hypothetical protein